MLQDFLASPVRQFCCYLAVSLAHWLSWSHALQEGRRWAAKAAPKAAPKASTKAPLHEAPVPEDEVKQGVQKQAKGSKEYTYKGVWPLCVPAAAASHLVLNPAPPWPSPDLLLCRYAPGTTKQLGWYAEFGAKTGGAQCAHADWLWLQQAALTALTNSGACRYLGAYKKAAHAAVVYDEAATAERDNVRNLPPSPGLLAEAKVRVLLQHPTAGRLHLLQ